MEVTSNHKIALVTGATNGIGESVTLGLVKSGYDLLVIARNRARYEELRRKALLINKKISMKLFVADLSLISSTKEALEKIKKSGITKVDLIFQSAGLIPGGIQLTEEGIEKTFAVSYLTRYLIIEEMMPYLLKSDDKVVFTVAGPGQNGKINFDDINFSKRSFQPMAVVKQFQKANDVYTVHLNEKYEGLRAYCYYPGLVNTQIHKNWPIYLRFFMNTVGRLIMIEPSKSAQVPIKIIKGSLKISYSLVNPKGKEIKVTPDLKSVDYQEKLIRLSQNLVEEQAVIYT